MDDRSREQRIEDALVAWREQRERDSHAESGAWLAAHPDLASELAARLAAEELLPLVFLDEPADPPKLLGDFRIVREIGRGGMGVVYEAEQLSMRRRVAIKTLHPAVTLDPRATERFRREAQAAGRVHHTSIVPVFAMGQEAGCWYYAMELVKGRSLAQILADLRRLGGTPTAQPRTPIEGGLGSSSGGREFYVRVARAFAGVADALQAAHSANVVHRDVKPSNLILDDDGTLKITDFGLARMEGELPTMTLTGAVIGTPSYMSPEQVRPDLGKIDGRTDVYSLGATLYEVLTLRTPFRGRVPEVLAGIVRGGPPSPRSFEARIPRDLETIVMKAMERDTSRRYRTAGEMGHDLLLFAEGASIRARRSPALVRAWRILYRRRRAVAATGAVVCTGGLALWAMLDSRSERDRRGDLEYDAAVRGAVAGLLEHARFAEGRVVRLSGTANGEILASLSHAAQLRPRHSEARLLPVLLTETSLDRQLADLDAAHRDGLDDRSWHRARAYALYRAYRYADARNEHAAAAGGAPDGDRLSVLIEALLLGYESARPAALALLDALLAGPSDAPDRPLALEARAFFREREGDLTGALEDDAALETQVGTSLPAVRMSIAGLYRRLGKADKASQIFDETLAVVRRSKRGDATGYAQLVDGCWDWMPVEWADPATAAAIEDLPEKSESWSLRARSLMCRPTPESGLAVECMRKAIALAGSATYRRDALVDLASMLTTLDRRPEALEACEQALAIDSRWAPASAAKARVLVRTPGRADEGLTLARQTALAEPTHVPLESLAWALEITGHPDDALGAYERALTVGPGCAACRRGRMRILLKASRWEELAVAARAAISIRSDDVVALRALCQACDALGRTEEGVQTCRALTVLQPNDARDWCNLANALCEADRPAEALPAVRHARELGLKGVNSYRVVADVLQRLGRTSEALEMLEKCVTTEDAPACVWREGAQMLLDASKPKEALAFAERGLAHFPTDAYTIHQKAVALYELGEKEAAIAAFARELEVDPGQAQAWSNAAMLEDELGRTDAAISRARAGVARTDAPGVRWVLGQILERHGRADEARQAWAPLLVAPKDKRAKTYCVDALVACGTRAEAAACVAEVRARFGVAEAASWAKDVVVAWRAGGSRQEDARALASGVAQWPDLAGEDGAYLLAIGGRKTEAARLAAGLPTPSSAPDAFRRACLYALLDRREDALESLRRAEHDGFKAPGAADAPDLAAYREDPEFRAVLQRFR